MAKQVNSLDQYCHLGVYDMAKQVKALGFIPEGDVSFIPRLHLVEREPTPANCQRSVYTLAVACIPSQIN